MIKLQESFVSGVGGFSGLDVLTYSLIERKGMFAVYERSKDGKIKDWETIQIKIIPKGTSIFNSPPSLDDEERYPSTGDFSKTAFSFHGKFGKNAALNKLEEMVKEKKQESAPEIPREFLIPESNFTIGGLAELNQTNYVTSFNWVKENIDKKIVFVEEKQLNSRGKKSKIFRKI